MGWATNSSGHPSVHGFFLFLPDAFYFMQGAEYPYDKGLPVALKYVVLRHSEVKSQT
jgi:hypothetical protein